jgi:hypothetical protein
MDTKPFPVNPKPVSVLAAALDRWTDAAARLGLNEAACGAGALLGFGFTGKGIVSMACVTVRRREIRRGTWVSDATN